MSDKLTIRKTIRITDQQNHNWNNEFIRKCLELRYKPIQWNTIKFIDNMDLLNGLPSIPDNTFELCITDPPYNVNFKGKNNEVNFKDKWTIEQYFKWVKTWFLELKRICKGILIFPGEPYCFDWPIYIEKPRDSIIHYKPNCQGFASIAYKSKKEHILCYGEFNKRFSTNVFKINVKTGKNRELKKGIHTTPKPLKLIENILKQLKPKTVLDCFMGSGTTALACIKLGIKFYGFEIDPIHAFKIKERIENIQKDPEQQTLMNILSDNNNQCKTSEGSK